MARVDGVRLAQARKEARLTQLAVAEQLGLSSVTRVSLWERGAEQPSPRFIPALATLYGVSPLDLLVGDPQHPTISALRLAAGLTREDLWSRAQVSKMTYHRIDRGVGVRETDPSVVRAIGRILGLTEHAISDAIREARRHAE